MTVGILSQIRTVNLSSTSLGDVTLLQCEMCYVRLGWLVRLLV